MNAVAMAGAAECQPIHTDAINENPILACPRQIAESKPLDIDRFENWRVRVPWPPFSTVSFFPSPAPLSAKQNLAFGPIDGILD